MRHHLSATIMHHEPMPSRQRHHGQPTRGKTAENRLRQCDVFVALAMPGVLRGDRPLVVDVGFGAKPWTTLEMAARWRRLEPSLRVVGVEIDAQRVAEAQPVADPPATAFVGGGFNLAEVLGGERARVVRCLNVLRQYDEAEVETALAAMAQGMEVGGVLVEGTSNPTGGLMVFDVWKRGGPDTALDHDALVFATNLREDVQPRDFQAILPKRLIHRMLDPVPAGFFADWQRAYEIARSLGVMQPRRTWAEAATILRVKFGHPVDPRRGLVERGFLRVRGALR
jgi:hypothetical protein